MNANAVLKSVGRNPVAKAVRTPEFRPRVVPLAKIYNRKKFRKQDLFSDRD